MYTIFFTINSVEQLTFFKSFVKQSKFEQLAVASAQNDTFFNFLAVSTYFVTCSTCVKQSQFWC